MPVDIDRFEDGPSGGDRPTSERLLRFLWTHDDQAVTRQEFADAVDRDPETVGTNLTRLKDRGLVRHRKPYWAFTGDRVHARAVLEDRYDDEVVAAILGSSGAGETAATHGAHRRAAQTYFEQVRDRLDEAVEALYLFGSVARTDETASSAVVLN